MIRKPPSRFHGNLRIGPIAATACAGRSEVHGQSTERENSAEWVNFVGGGKNFREPAPTVTRAPICKMRVPRRGYAFLGSRSTDHSILYVPEFLALFKRTARTWVRRWSKSPNLRRLASPFPNIFLDGRREMITEEERDVNYTRTNVTLCDISRQGFAGQNCGILGRKPIGPGGAIFRLPHT